MQIRNLVIYGSGDRIRILPFDFGKVNIITGESKTGKTAIVSIIDYCLGSSECHVPSGVIRDSAEWFGLTIKILNEEIFIARRNPSKLGQATTSDIFLFQAAEILSPPPISELENNSKAEALKRLLEGKLKISEYEHSPENPTRDNLGVTFSHARTYCFQPQDLIAQRSNLFYGQNSQDGGYVTQAIKDTLPYLLGAIREDNLRLEQDIAQKRKLLRRYQREYKIADGIRQEGVSKIYDFVSEAQEVELLPFNIYLEDEMHALDELSNIVTGIVEMRENPGENEVLNTLIQERSVLKIELEDIKSQVSAAKTFADEAQGYSSEANEQEKRLLSIGLYKEPEEGKNWNSLLGIETEDITPTIEQINKSLISLRMMLQNTTREQPKLRAYINGLETQQAEKENQIRLYNNQINAVYKEQEEAQKLQNLNIRKGKVIGRISLFLESLSLSDDQSNLSRRIRELEDEIEELESFVSKDEKEERLAAILNKINLQMSTWSSNLDIEYKGSPIRFDLKKLTLIADTIKESIPLMQMGSGANWVSYHLLIHFALHHHFIQTNRPVPKFLVLDQPSQVYYPPEKDDNPDLSTFQSADEIAVKQMFDFMFNVVESLEGKFQVIVTDHASLKYSKFEDSIVEIWRDGVKLIPSDWYADM